MSRLNYLVGFLTIFTLTASGVLASYLPSPESLTSVSENRATGLLQNISSVTGDMVDDPEPPAPIESTCPDEIGGTCDPPRVVSIRPNRDNVPIDVPVYWISIEFDHDMLGETFNRTTFMLVSSTGKLIPGTLLVEGRIATFIPSETLDYSTTYRVTVKGGQNGVQSMQGLPLIQDYSWNFTTESLEDMGPLVYHSFKIDDDISGESDGNGDHELDPGEAVELTVFLGNSGNSTASEVSGIITSSDPNITFISNTDSSYENIIGWGVEPNADDFEFSVDQDTPCGHLIQFEQTVSAAGGYSDIISFSVPVTCGAPESASSPSPATGGVDVSLNPDLSVFVSDPDNDDLTVTFYGREIVSPAAGEFEIIAIPDTQYYTCDGNSSSCPFFTDGSNETFEAQTQWVVDHQESIGYVPHVGDLVQNADWYEEEWMRADSAFSILDMGAPEIPYGIAFGNHDLRNLFGAGASVTGDTFLNQYFGSRRFDGRAYYGGHFSFNNNNHYLLFEKGDLPFIGIHLEYDREYEGAVIAWADDLLKQYPERRAIVSRHAIIDEDGNFVSDGEIVFQALRDNPNLFLFLCGHIDGEYIRADQYNGRTIYTILSDYQSEPNGGDGWLRRLQFSPDADQITVRSYSVLYDQWDWEDPKATGWQDLDYDMGYRTREIATISGVTSGSRVTATWLGLLPDSRYEWYVSVSDGVSTTISPLWDFTTAPDLQTCYPLSLAYTGSGGVPLALPANSQGCSRGEYLPGETIDLTANPALGFRVGSWTGTVNDASTSTSNQVVMPEGEHSATVHYVADFSLYLPTINKSEDL